MQEAASAETRVNIFSIFCLLSKSTVIIQYGVSFDINLLTRDAYRHIDTTPSSRRRGYRDIASVATSRPRAVSVRVCVCFLVLHTRRVRHSLSVSIVIYNHRFGKKPSFVGETKKKKKRVWFNILRARGPGEDRLASFL